MLVCLTICLNLDSPISSIVKKIFFEYYAGRRSKTRCFITEQGPPCNECKQTSRNCTFEEAPQKRKRKPVTTQDQNIQSTSTHNESSLNTKLSSSNSPLKPTTSNATTSNLGPIRNRKRSQQSQQLNDINFTPYISNDMSSLSNVFASLDLSTPESHEPHLVSIAPDDISPLLPPGPSLVRQLSLDPTRPVFAVFERKPHYRSSLDPGLALLSQVDQVLSQCHCSRDQLIQNYLDIIHPAYPVLPDINQTTPPYLLGAIYTSALIFTTNQVSTSINAWAILHVATHPDFDKPKLSTIAANLLDLNGRPSMDPRGNYIVLARTIAQAQLLGLHLDPTDWSIPGWERDLRIRLWWGCVIHSSSLAVYESKPLHISPADTDVPLPSLNSLPQPTASARAFRGMCALCHLLVRTHEALLTTRACRQKSRQERLQILFVIESEAQNFERESTPLEKSTGSLSFEWEILGLRIFLRKMALDAKNHGSAQLPDNQSLALVRKAVDFVTSLTECDIKGYWLIYAAHHFQTLLTLLLRLCLHSKEGALQPINNPSISPLGLLAKYSSFLQSTAKNYKWDLVHKALERAADVMVRLRKSGRSDILAALEGKFIIENQITNTLHHRSSSITHGSNNSSSNNPSAISNELTTTSPPNQPSVTATEISTPSTNSNIIQTPPNASAANAANAAAAAAALPPVRQRSASSLDFNLGWNSWDPNSLLSAMDNPNLFQLPTTTSSTSNAVVPAGTISHHNHNIPNNFNQIIDGWTDTFITDSNLMGHSNNQNMGHELHLNTMPSDPFDENNNPIGSLTGW